MTWCIDYRRGESFAQCRQCAQVGRIQPNPDRATVNRDHHPASPTRCLGCEWANRQLHKEPDLTWADFISQRYGTEVSR